MRTGLARLLASHATDRSAVAWLGHVPEGWHVAAEVRVGEGTVIDHLLVGPAGVFAVNAKNLTGQVWVGASGLRVNGHATDFVGEIRHGARVAAHVLSEELERAVTVEPVLVVLADGWTIHEAPTDVILGPPRAVRDRLVRLMPRILEAREAQTLAGAAADPTLWDDALTSS